MTSEKLPFRQRNQIGPDQQPRQRDELPRWIRGEFVHKLQKYNHSASMTAFYEALRPLIWEVTSKKPFGQASWDLIEDVLMRCPWGDFFEAAELAVTFIPDPTEAVFFQIDMNKLFAQDLLAWCFEEGEIVLAQPAEITAIIEEVKGILADPRFAGPNDDFRKANGHLNEKPTPDTENCVKDAVGALEGVAKIITVQPNATLGDLLKKGRLKTDIPLHLNRLMNELYAYRSSEGGVAHGKTGESTIPIEEANFVLSACASSIAYLGQKFPGVNADQ